MYVFKILPSLRVIEIVKLHGAVFINPLVEGILLSILLKVLSKL